MLFGENLQSDKKDYAKYFDYSKDDDYTFGLVCTTTGFQNVAVNQNYPLNFTKHLSSYLNGFTLHNGKFDNSAGRILNELQIIYITEGQGYFISQYCPITEVNAGTIIIVHPNVRHVYYPKKETGWRENWVGLKGKILERLIKNNVFPKEKPICKIGISETIINLYQNLFRLAETQNTGYQQLMAGIIFHLLAHIRYKYLNIAPKKSKVKDKINHACINIRENINKKISPVDIANELNIGYSLFRREFKLITGLSPNQYILKQKLSKSKELLLTTDLTISEIAFELQFENVSQFSSLFKKKEGMNASDFRKNYSFI